MFQSSENLKRKILLRPFIQFLSCSNKFEICVLAVNTQLAHVYVSKLLKYYFTAIIIPNISLSWVIFRSSHQRVHVKKAGCHFSLSLNKSIFILLWSPLDFVNCTRNCWTHIFLPSYSNNSLEYKIEKIKIMTITWKKDLNSLLSWGKNLLVFFLTTWVC